MTTVGNAGREPAPVPGKLARRIAGEAARMLAAGSGGDAQRARLRAARRVARDFVPEEQLPSHADIQHEVHREPGSGGDSTAGFAHLNGDRFARLGDLVRVLALVRQDPVKHPEGDALEHSLQVFALVREENPYDEELLTAALVHDVGRAIDRTHAVTAGLKSLDGLITPRTAGLIEALEAGRAHAAGTLGARARHRLEAHPDFLDCLLLAEADRKACRRGYPSPTLEEALQILRQLEADNTVSEAESPPRSHSSRDD